jgi:U3 small nucleolar RNA-associated protein 4
MSLSTGPAAHTLPLHRIRFYDQTPSPITCLAYPPLPLPPARDPSYKGKARDARPATGKEELGVLVVARQNGDIEIHQWAREHERGFGNWTCVKVCFGWLDGCLRWMLMG